MVLPIRLHGSSLYLCSQNSLTRSLRRSSLEDLDCDMLQGISTVIACSFRNFMSGIVEVGESFNKLPMTVGSSLSSPLVRLQLSGTSSGLVQSSCNDCSKWKCGTICSRITPLWWGTLTLLGVWNRCTTGPRRSLSRGQTAGLVSGTTLLLRCIMLIPGLATLLLPFLLGALRLKLPCMVSLTSNLGVFLMVREVVVCTMFLLRLPR